MDPVDDFSAEMPDSPSRPIAPLDDDTLERLLDGRLDPSDAPPGYGEVARLLRAAGGPARPDELAGQAAALAAFRAAGRRPVRGQRRRPPRPRWRARLVAVGVAGVLAVGGAAVAIPDGPPDPVDRVERPAARAPGSSPGGDPLLLQRPRSAPTTSTAVPSERAAVRHGGRSAPGHDGAAIHGGPKHKKDKPGTAKPPKPKKPKRR